MHFMQLLKSLDELLYEVMSWLVFFPLTLWRTLTQPITMMEYADSELHDPEEQQYEDALSPPLFLLLAILITQAISMSVDSGTVFVIRCHLSIGPSVTSQRITGCRVQTCAQ